MESAERVILSAVAVTGGAALAWFAMVSWWEGERRATRISAVLAIFAVALPLAAALLPPPWPSVGLYAVRGVVVALVLLWFAPVGGKTVFGGRPSRRVDERDIMFSRARLVPGSDEFESYYVMRPENRAGDDRTRALPGLLSADSEFADEVVFARAEASFDITEALRHEVDGEVASGRVDRESEAWADWVKELALSNGAVDVGVTRLKPYHVYTHIGRGSGVWGDPIEPEHAWAVAFSVEMDHAAVADAPRAPVVAESARQYVESAKIALHVAATIRRCGWPARAHIDGNYRVIAPLVARDAGLGEIGRLGLLMTPRLGPRVRLGVVTTDLPLEADEPGDSAAVLDFCTFCRKCADACPVGAIPQGERTALDDALRWAIDPDTCFRYWNIVGTDCGVCMKVCPYSHPDNAAHNLVRWAIGRSGGARRAMLRMDDLFYGRKPKNG